MKDQKSKVNRNPGNIGAGQCMNKIVNNIVPKKSQDNMSWIERGTRGYLMLGEFAVVTRIFFASSRG